MNVDCPLKWADCGFFQETNISEGHKSKARERVDAFLGLQVPNNGVVQVRIATSFISVEQVECNLERELRQATWEH